MRERNCLSSKLSPAQGGTHTPADGIRRGANTVEAPNKVIHATRKLPRWGLREMRWKASWSQQKEVANMTQVLINKNIVFFFFKHLLYWPKRTTNLTGVTCLAVPNGLHPIHVLSTSHTPHCALTELLPAPTDGHPSLIRAIPLQLLDANAFADPQLAHPGKRT